MDASDVKRLKELEEENARLKKMFAKLSLAAAKRYSSVHEVASLVYFLAHPEGGFITGASIMVDGGFSA